MERKQSEREAMIGPPNDVANTFQQLTCEPYITNLASSNLLDYMGNMFEACVDDAKLVLARQEVLNC